jgi:hypothetical protein
LECCALKFRSFAAVVLVVSLNLAPVEAADQSQPTLAGGATTFRTTRAGALASAMGKITLQAADGSEVTVDKTFAYRRDADGRLRIIAHHSSLPWAG